MGDTKIICRFCLIDENGIEYINVFKDVPSDFITKINNCLSIQLMQTDGLPIFGCFQCIQKINQFDNFKKMCCDSYEYLIKSIQNKYEKNKSLCKAINPTICMDNNEQHIDNTENDDFSNESEGEDEYSYSDYQKDNQNRFKLNKLSKQMDFNEVDDSVGN